LVWSPNTSDLVPMMIDHHGVMLLALQSEA
jgi:hypothetical protein